MFGLGESCVGKFPFGCSWGRRGLVPRMVVRARQWPVWQIRTWAKSLLPRWPGLSLKEKEKKILDGKKNEITVCQREIDRSGREGGRFLLCFCLLVSKQAFCPGQGKQKWKTLISHLSSTLFALWEGPSLVALAISSFLARQGCAGMRTAQLCEKLVPAPCPVLVKAASGVKATGFEMTSSLSRGGSELSISCWARTWVAQSRCDPQPCQAPPWENIHLQISTNYLHVLHLQMGLIFFWDLRCYHSMGGRGLCWAGMAPLSQQPQLLSVCFLLTGHKTLYKRNTTLFLIRKLEQGKCFA